jgi:hypothetical protein
MCVLIFSTASVWNISQSKKNWVSYDKKKYIDLHVKYRLLLSDCNETWIFPTDLKKNAYSDTSADEDNSFRNHIR